MKWTIAILLLLVAGAAAAQEAGLAVMGMRVGKDSLSDVLSRIGNTPLAPRGDQAPDELCYAAENPFESTWVVFGSGASGRWERLTHIRVLSAAPPGLSCRRTPMERLRSLPSAAERCAPSPKMEDLRHSSSSRTKEP